MELSKPPSGIAEVKGNSVRKGELDSPPHFPYDAAYYNNQHRRNFMDYELLKITTEVFKIAFGQRNISPEASMDFFKECAKVVKEQCKLLN